MGLSECLKHKNIAETVDSACKDKQRTPLHMASRVRMVELALTPGSYYNILMTWCSVPSPAQGIYNHWRKQDYTVEALFPNHSIHVTVFFFFLQSGKLDFVQSLMDRDPRLLVKDKLGNTPLHYAAERYPEILDSMLKKAQEFGTN